MHCLIRVFWRTELKSMRLLTWISRLHPCLLSRLLLSPGNTSTSVYALDVPIICSMSVVVLKL